MPTIHQNRKLLLQSCTIILILLITRSPTPLSNHKFMAVNFLLSNFYILVYLFIFISALFAVLHQAHLQDTWHHNLSSLVDLLFSRALYNSTVNFKASIFLFLSSLSLIELICQTQKDSIHHIIK